MSRLADILGALSVAADARDLKRNNARQRILSAYGLVPKFRHRRRCLRVSSRADGHITAEWWDPFGGVGMSVQLATPVGYVDVTADPDCPSDMAYVFNEDFRTSLLSPRAFADMARALNARVEYP